MDSLSGLAIRLYPEDPTCLVCGSKTNLLKTDAKTCYSFDLGKFKLISGSNYCVDHKYFGKPGQIIRYESNLAAMLVDKGYRVTFDLVVKVGRLRYDEHRQLREIQAYLKCSSAKLDLPLSTISLICIRFLEFCQKLHASREDEIRRDIKQHGGYVLHFDGSTEQKSGRCNLILFDSRCEHVLESSMIDSESCETITVALKRVLKKYGHPLAVVSDLRPGFVSSCVDAFGSKVRHILCHYHFLRTFRDAFNDDHQFMKTTMTQKWQLQAGLTKQIKALPGSKASTAHPRELKTIESIEKHWETTGDTLATYRHTLCWILNYKQDSSGKGVPFDLPFLDLFYRLTKGKDLIDKVFAKASREIRMKYYFHGFCRVLEKTNHLGANEKGFRKAVRHLEFARKWFDKLRAVLFLEGQLEADRPLAPLSKQYRLTEKEAKRIPLRLSGLLASLKRELKQCKHQERKAYLENLKKQIVKYRGNLHVPLIATTIDDEEVYFVPPRTNNCLESIFRSMKALIRRCTGRSKLPREFAAVGDLLPYYLLMKDHAAFKEVFNDDQRLS